MHPKRKKRLWLMILVVAALAVTTACVLYALQQNIDLYFTPSQIDKTAHIKLPQFRVGGMVKKHSLKQGKDLNVDFVVTDFSQEIAVHYRGILPALFREGQGVVIEGHLTSNGTFEANRVLAKHDEKYMPPGLKNTKQGSQAT